MYDATPVIGYLDSRLIGYELDSHPPRVTAQETAQVEHVSGKRFAKTIVVKDGECLFLAVLPAHLRVDLRKLQAVRGSGPLALADEEEFEAIFGNCELGAMPPFGKLYSQPGANGGTPLEVVIDDDIATAPTVTFNACSHQHTITLSGKDFLKAAEGVVADISTE